MARAEYRNAIRSRKLINTAFADLLQEKPLDKITVTDVVRRAEINRGTFYAHYNDINDVINHLIQQTFSDIKNAISGQSVTLPEIAHILLFKIQSILEEDLDFYKKLMNSTASSVMQEQLAAIVQEYLFEHEKSFGVGDHEESILKIRFCAGGIMNLYLAWFSGNLSLTLDELTAKATKLIECVMDIS